MGGGGVKNPFDKEEVHFQLQVNQVVLPLDLVVVVASSQIGNTCGIPLELKTLLPS